MPAVLSTIVDCYVFRRAGDATEFLQMLRSAESRIGASWQSVHGKIEPGELAWQAALRELREETGLTPLRFWQLESVNTFYEAGRDAVILCPCFAAEVSSDAAVVLCDEHTAHRWLRFEDALREFMWPGQRRSVQEVMELIVTPNAAERFLRIPLDGG